MAFLIRNNRDVLQCSFLHSLPSLHNNIKHNEDRISSVFNFNWITYAGFIDYMFIEFFLSLEEYSILARRIRTLFYSIRYEIMNM